MNEMLKKCDLYRYNDISNEIINDLKHYKRISNGIPKIIEEKRKIISGATTRLEVASIKTKAEPLNPPKDKRYPTPERKFSNPTINNSVSDIKVYSYEELKRKINGHPKDIVDLQHSNYEKHLSEEEFIQIFKMTQNEFYSLSNWRQTTLKKQQL